MRNYLPGKLEIGCRARRPKIVKHDRLPVARSLAKSYITRDYRHHDLLPEVLLGLGLHLGCQAGPPVEHGEDYALDLEVRIQALPNEADGLDDVSEPFHGVVLAL